VRAAVLVPILGHEEGLELLLVRRAPGLAAHPGQVAFPGGAVEAGDADVEAAALREAREEVALDPTAVEIVGRLQDFRTPTGFVITPLVGSSPADVDLRAAVDEVELMIRLPVSHLLDPATICTVTAEWRGLLHHGEALVFGEHLIWGATARMLIALRRTLLLVDGPWRADRRKRVDMVDRSGSDRARPHDRVALRW
jgi:8-oxo-dGTP pyrophosphatase MutT (NUDIX family)